MITVLVVIELVGFNAAAKLHVVLVVLDLGSQALLAVVGLLVFFSPRILVDQIHLGIAPTWHQLIYGLAIATVAYTGIELLSSVAEKSSEPRRQVPRAVKYALTALIAVFVAISLSACQRRRRTPTSCPSIPGPVSSGQCRWCPRPAACPDRPLRIQE